MICTCAQSAILRENLNGQMGAGRLRTNGIVFANSKFYMLCFDSLFSYNFLMFYKIYLYVFKYCNY